MNDMLEVTDRHISGADAALLPALRQALTTDELHRLGAQNHL